MPSTLVDILERTSSFFEQRGIDSPRLDAELLLCHVLHLQRLQLYLNFDRPLQPAELDALRPLVARRGKREPLAWIVGERGFHAIDLDVHTNVLVPRPDTETLVETLLELLPEPTESPIFVADIGCGTGAVGLAIAYARPDVRVYSVDISEHALKNTRANVKKLGLEKRVAVLAGDLLSPIPAHRPIDWIVSNPPYIPTSDLRGLMPEVSTWEPSLALDGGDDGLHVYRLLIPAAVTRAKQGVLVEIGQGQETDVSALFTSAGVDPVLQRPDLGSVIRVVGGRVPQR